MKARNSKGFPTHIKLKTKDRLPLLKGRVKFMISKYILSVCAAAITAFSAGTGAFSSYAPVCSEPLSDTFFTYEITRKLFSSANSDSAGSQGMSVTKANRTHNAVRLFWKPVNCSGYRIYMYSPDTQNWNRIADIKDPSADQYRVSGLKMGTEYKFKVFAYKFGSQEDFADTQGSVFSIFTKSGPPELLSLSSDNKTVTVKWSKVEGATGYRIFRYDAKTGEFISQTSIKNNKTFSWTDKKVSSGVAYKYKLKSYVKADGVNYWSDYSNTLCTAVKPGNVNVAKANRTYDAVRLFWEPVKCNGYQIYMYSADTKQWKHLTTVRNPSADQYRVSGLKRGTQYKFKIRAYKCDAERKNHFGSFGSVFSVSTKPEIVKKNGVTYVEGILIANKTYSLPSDYNPDMNAEAMQAFYKMQKAARRDGINLWICSGFRSYSYQKYLYNSYVARDGKAAADRYSARAGHSEHQTGLAMDINNAGSSFEGTREAKWLAAHCSDYGFIIRYPKGKESVTGYKYEPWHIRYLGVKTAKAVEKSGLCLEEYLGITSEYK